MTLPRSPHSTPAVERVRRWQVAGGTWQVLRRTQDEVVVSLCRCDGGEEADRVTSTDPELLAYLAGRDSSEEA